MTPESSACSTSATWEAAVLSLKQSACHDVTRASYTAVDTLHHDQQPDLPLHDVTATGSHMQQLAVPIYGQIDNAI